MTIRLAILLVGLHLISAFTTLAFSPDSCEPGDVGCGDSAVSEIVRQGETEGGPLGGSFFGIIGVAWDSIKSFLGPIYSLISFEQPWLQGDDLPRLADWLIDAVGVFFAVLHLVVVANLLSAVLGRIL